MNKKVIMLTAAFLFSMEVTFAAPSGIDVMKAINFGDVNQIQMYLDSGIDPNGAAGGLTYLAEAAGAGNKEIVSLLLKHGGDINHIVSGVSPLSVAIMNQNTDMVKFLLDNGADPNIKMSGALSMKALAKQFQNNEMVEMLIAAEQKTKQLNGEGNQIARMKVRSKELNTPLATLEDKDMEEIKLTAKDLINKKDLPSRIGYLLGIKNYAWLTSNHAPQRVEVITPYSLMKYTYFVNGRNFKEPSQYTIDQIKNYSDVVWIWIWSNTDMDLFIGGYNLAPNITNVVIKTNKGKVIQPLEGTNIPIDVMNAAGVTTGSLWSFPIEAFDTSNTPFEIIMVDTEMNQKPLKVTDEQLRKLR